MTIVGGWTAVVVIATGEVKVCTRQIGLAATHNSGGTAYNFPPARTPERAEAQAKSCADEFVRRGYRFDQQFWLVNHGGSDE